MIIFHSVFYKNFLSAGNDGITVTLDKNPTTLIVGKNGAGKSTMIAALCFALFNKPYRGINKPQLVNTINNKNCIVEVSFSHGANKYKVVRGIKPTIFEIYCNDILIDQNAAGIDYQQMLEQQILKISFKTFCQVVILGSTSYIPFMQLTAQHRREIVEDLLDIKIFSAMNAVLKQMISDNDTKIIDNNHQIQLINQKYMLTKQHIEQLDAANKLHKQQLTVQLQSIEQNIKQHNKTVGELARQVKQLSPQLDQQAVLIKQLSDEQSLSMQLEVKADTLDSQIKFFSQHDNCPTCNQIIGEQFKYSATEQRQQKLNLIEQTKVKLVKKIKKINNQIEQFSEIKKTIDDYNSQINGIQYTINSLTRQKDTITNQLQQITKPTEVDVDQLKEIERQQSNAEKYKSELLDRKQLLSIISLLLKDTGVKAQIIKQYVGVINQLINKYLAALDFFCNFELDENFNETIKSRHRDIFSYHSFSEGEKMRINLAILFTWRALTKLRNSASTNLLIMDEVLDGSLDVQGTEEFLKIINQLTSDTNCFIISHKVDQLSDKFQHVFKFDKRNNFSSLIIQ